MHNLASAETQEEYYQSSPENINQGSFLPSIKVKLSKQTKKSVTEATPEEQKTANSRYTGVQRQKPKWKR